MEGYSSSDSSEDYVRISSMKDKFPTISDLDCEDPPKIIELRQKIKAVFIKKNDISK